jgi:hypothetical protein|tara:strand:- start:20 stop:184 length:165 start_codon:yes stop_codon:yes gene_type:complete
MTKAQTRQMKALAGFQDNRAAFVRGVTSMVRAAMSQSQVNAIVAEANRMIMAGE